MNRSPLAGWSVASPVVYQGGQRVDAPTALGLLGDPDGEMALRRRIANQRSASSFLKGIAAVGVVGMVTGLSRATRADDLNEQRQWQGVFLAGVGVTMGGLITAGLPGSRADQLERDLSLSTPAADLPQRIDAYNARLASELDLRGETLPRATPPEELFGRPDCDEP